MKLLLTIALVLGAHCIFAQESVSERWEKAVFTARTENLKIEKTTIEIYDHQLSKEQLLNMELRLPEKEGMLEMTSQEGKILEFYHMSYVETEYIKSLFTGLVDRFEVIEVHALSPEEQATVYQSRLNH